MRNLCIIAGCVIVMVCAAIALMPVNAAQEPVTAPIPRVNAELIVFESDNCPYCFIFRRDVVPGYLQSPRAKNVPLRFINVDQIDQAKLGLRAPLTTVPTVVLMHDGQEVDRITGYMGPEPFFHMVSRIMR